MAKRGRDSGGGSAVSEEGQSHGDEELAPRRKKPRVEEKKTLFVRSLPTSATGDSLTDWFSEHYPVKHATVVIDSATKSSRGYGFVTFTDAEDATAAKETLDKALFDGRRVRLEFAEQRHRVDGRDGEFGVVSAAKEQQAKRKLELAEAKKAPKLIVRNLPWSIKSPDQLAALFRSYGKVKYVDLPNNKGKLSGFGFVTLRGKSNAQKAIESINGKVVDGRTLAVDWAVDKATWEQQKDADQADVVEEDGERDSEDAAAASAPQKTADSAAEEEEVQDDEEADLENFMKTHMENMEDEEEEGSDLENGDEESDGNSTEEPETPAPKPHMSSDNSTTLFIRNLPYTTTDEELKTHFTQFGPVRYARCVMERSTDRPAGTGFVCFFNTEDFKSCLRGAPRQTSGATSVKHSVLQNESVDHDGRYTIDGRVLQVSQAVSKEEATRLSAEGPSAKRGESKDKRRLFLLAEGTIGTNSPLAAMLTPSEMKMRETSARQRQKLVQSNPSLYVSLTRLALRNIPRNLDSKALKALAREAVVGFAKDADAGRRAPLSREEIARGGQEDKEAERRRKEKRHGVVRQAKIIFESREGSKVTEQKGDGGGAKSRGYGFIEYSSHRWALMGLRWLNGHALRNEAGKTQRLIVEFAIENAQVVTRRRNAQENARGRGKGEDPQGDQGVKAGTPKRMAGAKAADSLGKKAKAKGPTTRAGAGSVAVKEASDEKGDSKLALRQKIIGRKRMMRKKKRGASGQKK